MGSGNSTDNKPNKTLQLAQDYIEKAKGLTGKGDIQSAIEEYDKAIGILQKKASKDSPLTLAKNLLIQSYVDIAKLYQQQKFFETAKLYYEKAEQLGSQDAGVELKELMRLMSVLTVNSTSPQIPVNNINNDSDASSVVVITPSIKPDDEIKTKRYFIQNPANYKLRKYNGSYDDIKGLCRKFNCKIQYFYLQTFWI